MQRHGYAKAKKADKPGTKKSKGEKIEKSQAQAKHTQKKQKIQL